MAVLIHDGHVAASHVHWHIVARIRLWLVVLMVRAHSSVWLWGWSLHGRGEAAWRGWLHLSLTLTLTPALTLRGHRAGSHVGVVAIGTAHATARHGGAQVGIEPCLHVEVTPSPHTPSSTCTSLTTAGRKVTLTSVWGHGLVQGRRGVRRLEVAGTGIAGHLTATAGIRCPGRVHKGHLGHLGWLALTGRFNGGPAAMVTLVVAPLETRKKQ
jgi:hypothetical protein